MKWLRKRPARGPEVPLAALMNRRVLVVGRSETIERPGARPRVGPEPDTLLGVLVGFSADTDRDPALVLAAGYDDDDERVRCRFAEIKEVVDADARPGDYPPPSHQTDKERARRELLEQGVGMAPTGMPPRGMERWWAPGGPTEPAR